MQVVLIAPVAAERVAEIAAVDPRIEVTDAWEVFAPEIVAEWPAQTTDWYLPPRLRALPDSPAQQRQRDALLATAEVVCIVFPFPRRLASRAPRLRLVHQLPAGVSNLRRGDLWQGSVPVTSGRGLNGTLPIAEWAVTMALAMLKDLPRAFEQRATGTLDRQAFNGRLVAGKTLGVVGLGGIGREVARLATALGMRVVGTRRSDAPVAHVERLYRPTELHAMLAACDVVVVATQLTDETEGMIDAAAFAAMKPGGLVVNVARGELLDEAALADALRSGQVGGFAADVYAGEFDRPPPAELLAFGNVILTPHTSGMAETRPDGPLAVLRENLRCLLDGRPLVNQVDWARGY